jgi:phosphoenolpyruvate phosphomutase
LSNKTTIKKTTRLKQLVQQKELAFLMEAHNGLSAKIAEEAGFEGIWGSGLSISAALGVRDNNEASWTQVLEVVEFMSDATRVPILLDGDTGYGNFNSMRRLVHKLEQRGIAGVCIEDKLFPKTNSFIRGTAQPLADPEEFAGKIRAAKEAQNDPDFVVVARVEALIAGHGMEEALKRGEMYRQAGADAILIHSAQRHPNEILQFKREWGDRLPVVIVPTKYYTTPTDVFRELGFSVVIWANHQMRSAVTAMQATARRIFVDQHLMNVEEEVAPLAEVFRLQGEKELEEAEKLYLPKTGAPARAIVLAASRGEELGELTTDRPKAMIPIAGKPLLDHVASSFRAAGIRDITVVRGYKKDAVKGTGLTFVDNDDYDKTQEVGSLKKAITALEGTTLIAYGDVLFKKYIPEKLVDHEGDFVVAVDAKWQDSNNKGRLADYAICSEPSSKRALFDDVLLTDIVTDPDTKNISGEWMGFVKVSAKGATVMREIIGGLDDRALASLKVPDLLRLAMKKGHKVHVVYSSGDWLDVDSLADVLKGSAFK